jgi:aryl-alcohol dehydrogenase-like predicted oxidoreductase
MHYRPLGRTGWNVSTISFGAPGLCTLWQGTRRIP